LKYELERQILKYIIDPSVTITASTSPTNVNVILREIVMRTLEVPKGKTLGQLLAEYIPKFQREQLPLNLEAIVLLGSVQSYRVTPQTLDALKTEGLPDEALLKLQNLQGREYSVVKQFLSDIQSQLGEEQTKAYRGIILQHAEPVREKVDLNGFQVSQGVDPKGDIKLAWGDEIVIPVLGAAPEMEKPVETMMLPKETYDELQTFLKDYPADQKILQPFLHLEGEQATVDREQIPWDRLSAEVRSQLEQILAAPPAEQPPADLTLVGIAVNLTAADLFEAFFALQDPDSEGEYIIKGVREKDLVKEGDTSANNLYLEKIDADAKKVILKKGENPITMTLTSKFTDLTLSGVLNNQGAPEAILNNVKSNARLTTAATKPVIRKRFRVGDEVEEGVQLAKITSKWVLLKKGPNIQLVLLRDFQKQPTEPEPLPSASASAAPAPAGGEKAPGTTPPLPPNVNQTPPPEGVSPPAETPTLDTLKKLLPPTFACSPAKTCAEVSSCEEALYLYTQCNQFDLDATKSGIPCETTVCKDLRSRLKPKP
jgi:hypothetical protein